MLLVRFQQIRARRSTLQLRPPGYTIATIITRFCRRVGASENGEDTLPRRVLDLSDGRIRLVETIAGQQGHYVALSHCWGKEQLLTTTRDTFASRVNGIELHDMPRTFQDSIQITRSLGIRYIWIDSLLH